MRGNESNAVGCYKFELNNVDVRNMRRGRVMVRAEAVGERGHVYAYTNPRSIQYGLQAVGRRGLVAMFEMSLAQISRLANEQHKSARLLANERSVSGGHVQRQHQNQGSNFTLYVGIWCGGPRDRCALPASLARAAPQPIVPFLKLAVLEPVPLAVPEPVAFPELSSRRLITRGKRSTHVPESSCRTFTAPINLTHLNSLIVHYRNLETMKFCVGQCRSSARF